MTPVSKTTLPVIKHPYNPYPSLTKLTNPTNYEYLIRRYLLYTNSDTCQILIAEKESIFSVAEYLIKL